MVQPLELWFDFASTYSYVAALRVERECREAGVPLIWRPFLCGPLFAAQLGVSDSPFNVHPARGRYMWRDLERLCAKFELPWKRPSSFPRNSVLAARVAAYGADESWIGPFTQAVFRANFAGDLDIAKREVIAALLGEIGCDAEAILTAAEQPEQRAKLRANTDAAAAHGMFGAPSFRIGDELFFGQDRLTDALAWARR